MGNIISHIDDLIEEHGSKENVLNHLKKSNMKNLIGCSGKAGSGKDAVASMINELTGNYYQIKRFAGKLKQIASLLIGINAEDFNKQEIKEKHLGDEWGMTVRELLQKLGTDAVRDGLHKDAWANALFADYKPYSNWIIPDVRFPNEYQAIKKRGGIVIRIERNSIIKSNHPSETALDINAFDYTIYNNGTLKELEAEVFKLISKIKERFLASDPATLNTERNGKIYNP